MNRVPDILGVYVLPLCCFVADYAAGYLGTELYPLTLWTFGAAGMTAFALSGRAMSSRARASVAAGAMLVAAAGAGLIAVPLFFVGMFGVVGVFALLTSGDPIALLFALGILAFVPILTANRLAKRAREVLRVAPRSAAQITAGAAAILLPTGLAFLVEAMGDQRREADLRSKDRDRVLRALARDSWYGPRDLVGRPVWAFGFVCENLSFLRLDDPDIEAAARAAIEAPAGKSVREDCGPK